MNFPDSSPKGISPILARLSFWVSTKQRDKFRTAYEKKVVPVLKKHGLVESLLRPRTTAEEVFSRLFEVRSLKEIAKKQEELQADIAWQKILHDFGAAFGTIEPGGLLKYRFCLYSTPVVLDKIVQAGEDRGHWRTMDAADGLAENMVYSIFQDQKGNLWFGTESGVSQYDGERFTTFTTQDGLVNNTVLEISEDREGSLWFSTYAGVSRYDGERFTTFTTQDGLAHNVAFSIFQDGEGYLWFGSGFTSLEGAGVSRYDGEKFTIFSIQDGLVHNSVLSIFQDRENYLWFGTESGVSRYDGQTFTSFTTDDGLIHNVVTSISQDREGYLWFGTRGGGASRYDGQTFTSFTTDDGLAHDIVFSISQDREGYLWFGTYGGGVSRYDSQTMATISTDNFISGTLQDRECNLWVGTLENGLFRYTLSEKEGKTVSHFTMQNGLTGTIVRCLCQDREGRIWIGTFDGYVSCYDGQTWSTFASEDGLPDYPLFSILEDRQGDLWFCTQNGGVSRYDGEWFTTFTTDDGLAHNDVRCSLQDQKGNFWFGTFGGGVSRYDGQNWTTFTVENGLGGNLVQEGAIFQDREGRIWIGTRSGGISRYDGERFTTFTTDDGLAHNTIWSITQDREGQIWIGTSGGVTRYDGHVFQTLTQEDGLPCNAAISIFQDREGYVWIGTRKGLSRYCRSIPNPPPVFIDAVVADQRYEGISDLTVPFSTGLTVFEIHGMSFKTRPGGLVYRYRLKRFDKEWQTTRERRVEYQGLPVGMYEFEVVAVDRDLVYSKEPATVRLVVTPDPRDEQIDELEHRVRERTRELEKTHRQLEETQARLIDELEGELQTAHDLQMGLMPKDSPKIQGFDIAGRCLPANHVGGDFFQYFEQDSKLSVCLADVTGHAMEAAVPVMMFSGILHSQMEEDHSVEKLLGRLNGSLHATLERRTFICFTMGELHLTTRTLHLANCGCPYPLHYQATTGLISELQMDAYPLGIRAGSAYETWEVQLKSGDRIVFCSDGIVEADNPAGDMFGFERTAETIRQACAEGLSAEGVIDRLISAVKAFAGDEPQGDDMTVVVLKVEG